MQATHEHIAVTARTATKCIAVKVAGTAEHPVVMTITSATTAREVLNKLGLDHDWYVLGIKGQARLCAADDEIYRQIIDGHSLSAFLTRCR